MTEGAFIDDDCLIKDEIFMGTQHLVICVLCKKVLKNPMKCKNCQKSYCKVCIDKKGECTTDNCLSDEFVENTSIYTLLKFIKYKCSNCEEIVEYNDVEKHLKDGCQKKENEPTLIDCKEPKLIDCIEPKLIDCIKQKRRLKKLTSNEVEKAKRENRDIYHLSSKL